MYYSVSVNIEEQTPAKPTKCIVRIDIFSQRLPIKFGIKELDNFHQQLN